MMKTCLFLCPSMFLFHDLFKYFLFSFPLIYSIENKGIDDNINGDDIGDIIYCVKNE